MWEARSSAGSVMPVNRAAGSPIIHQGGAEDVLADALDDEPLDLGRLRQKAARKGDRAVFAPDTRLCTAPRWPRAAAELAVV